MKKRRKTTATFVTQSSRKDRTLAGGTDSILAGCGDSIKSASSRPQGPRLTNTTKNGPQQPIPFKYSALNSDEARGHPDHLSRNIEGPHQKETGGQKIGDSILYLKKKRKKSRKKKSKNMSSLLSRSNKERTGAGRRKRERGRELDTDMFAGTHHGQELAAGPCSFPLATASWLRPMRHSDRMQESCASGDPSAAIAAAATAAACCSSNPFVPRPLGSDPRLPVPGERDNPRERGGLGARLAPKLVRTTPVAAAAVAACGCFYYCRATCVPVPENPR